MQSRQGGFTLLFQRVAIGDQNHIFLKLARPYVVLLQDDVRSPFHGDDVEVTVAGALDDPWRMEVGFAVQMIFIFIDTDGVAVDEDELRTELLEAQLRLRESNIPVIVIVAGVEAAGKGEVVNRLNEWLDTRGVQTFAYWEIEADAPLPEHSHPHEQVANLLEGEFELTIDGRTERVQAGAVAVIPPNVPHSGRALTACRILDVFSPVREDYR